MIGFNRFLICFNFFIAVAVVAAAVLFNARKHELRERADVLQKSYIELIEGLQGKAGDENYVGANYIDFVDNPQEDDFNKDILGWKSYAQAIAVKLNEQKAQAKKDNTALNLNYAKATQEWRETNIDKASKIASDYMVYKAALAETIVALGNIHSTPSLSTDGKKEEARFALNTFDGHKEVTDKISAHLTKMLDREKTIITQFVAVSEAIKKPVEGNDISSLDNLDGQYKAALTQLVNEATRLHAHNENYRAFAGKIAAAAPLFTFETDFDAMGAENLDAQNEALEKFVKIDIPALNKYISDLAKKTEDFEIITAKLAEKEEIIENLGKKVRDLTNQVATQAVTILRQKKIIDLHDTGDPKLPSTFKANVVAYEDQYDFVVLDKGSLQQAVKGGDLIIARNGVFVCRAKITRVLANKCIAEIEAGSRASSPMVGDKIIPFK